MSYDNPDRRKRSGMKLYLQRAAIVLAVFLLSGLVTAAIIAVSTQVR